MYVGARYDEHVLPLQISGPASSFRRGSQLELLGSWASMRLALPYVLRWAPVPTHRLTGCLYSSSIESLNTPLDTYVSAGAAVFDGISMCKRQTLVLYQWRHVETKLS